MVRRVRTTSAPRPTVSRCVESLRTIAVRCSPSSGRADETNAEGKRARRGGLSVAVSRKLLPGPGLTESTTSSSCYPQARATKVTRWSRACYDHGRWREVREPVLRPPFGQGQGRSAANASLRRWGGRGRGCCRTRRRPPEGLPCGVSFPSDLMAPPQVAGIDIPVTHAPHRRVKTCREHGQVWPENSIWRQPVCRPRSQGWRADSASWCLF